MPATPEQCRLWRQRNRDKERAYRREYHRRHPERNHARDAVFRALKRGRLKKEPCRWCYSTKRVQAHHDDYSKPLEVMWFCQTCHLRYHRLLKEAGIA